MIINELASSSSTVLVTGGSGGIGQAIAKKLAAENMHVVTADIVEPVQEFEGIIYRKCDVTNGNEVDTLYSWMNNHTGMPDILVLNAGKGIHEKLVEGDPEKWQEILDLNIMGVLRFIRAFVPPMAEKKRGHVIFISSVSATQPYTYGGVYSASKAAVEMIAETLRLEVMPHVRVSVVAAGITDTGFFKNQVSGSTNIEEIGMGWLNADDIAEDVLYVINKRGNAGINKIITRPSGQNF